MLNFNTAQEASFGRVTVESGSLEDRLVFIKKVYTLLAASLATAAIGAYLGTGPLLPIVASNRMILFILMIGLIFFAQFARHKPGLNMIALFSFTTVSGLTLGPLLYAVGPSIATQAFALTAITFGGLTMYVVFSKKDFTILLGLGAFDKKMIFLFTLLSSSTAMLASGIRFIPLCITPHRSIIKVS